MNRRTPGAAGDRRGPALGAAPRPPRWARLLLALGIGAALPPSAHATVVPAMGFDQMVSEAELIVRGTVSEVEPRWSDDESTIHTYVTFADVAVIRGQHFGPLTLRFEGGEIGEHRLEVDGMPSFRKGEEEILFVRGNRAAISPVIGLFQGRFKVVDGFVHDHAGAPLVGLSDGTLVKLVDDRPVKDASPISVGQVRPAEYRYEKHPDHDRAEAILIAAAAAEAARGRYPKAGDGKGTGVDDTGGRDPEVLSPPRPVTGGGDDGPAPRPTAIYVPLSQDTGQRLTAAEFVDAIRARLGE